MSQKYLVNADVIDIRHYTPSPSDKILVDTNVWFWKTYPNCSIAPNPPQAYQLDNYGAFLKKAIEARAGIYWSVFTFGELSHLIEKTEYEINAGNAQTLKEWRHAKGVARKALISTINAAWNQVQQIGVSAKEICMGGSAAETMRKHYGKWCVDGNDLLLIHTYESTNVNFLLSDDGDFCSVGGLRLLTANQSVIKSAKEAKRLKTG